MPETTVRCDAGPDPVRQARTEAIVQAYARMMHSVALAHAPEFLGVGITMSQAKVLYLVQASPDLHMSDLATRLSVSLSTVSGVVDRLVDQGLLTRHDDPADRRQVVLRIADAGTAQLEHFRELNAGQFRALLARVGDADLVVVQHALDILAAASAAEPDATPVASPASGGSPR